MKPVVINIFFVLLFCSCNTPEDDDFSSPDFTYEGSLTEIEDGSPKVGWQVVLSRYIVQIPVTVDNRKVILGFDSVDENGDFGFNVKISQADFDEFIPSPFETGTKLEAFYRSAIIEIAPPNASTFPGSLEPYLPLDRANFITGLHDWQESQIGQVINSNLRAYTGEQANISATFRVERPVIDGERLTGTLALRDLAFGGPYAIRGSVNSRIGLPIDQGLDYTIAGRLPLNRPVETTFRFRTFDGSITIDSLTFKDTLVAVDLADTIFLPEFVY